MGLKQADIFNPDGSIKQNAFIHDRKTGKPNTLYLRSKFIFAIHIHHGSEVPMNILIDGYAGSSRKRPILAK